jgi:GT2 family glycosyltransferase
MRSSSSVVIVNWNSGTLLRQCVGSVLRAAPDSDIVVVDNASDDRSADSLQEHQPQVRLIRNNVNQGFAAAVNQGFHETSSPYVLILNPDVEAMPRSIEFLVSAIENDPKAGAVGGYVNDKYLPRNLPSPVSMVRENLGVARRRTKPVVSTGPVEQPAAAALIVRRAAYEEIRGFDARFFPAWYEDVDFCRRLKAAGWKIYFERRAEFRHHGGYSAQLLGSAKFAEAYYRNQLRYAHKHFSRAGRFTVRASIAAGMMVRMAIRPRNAGAFARVIWGVLGGWHD